MTTFMSTSAVESSVYSRSRRGSPSTIPTETAAIESASARESPKRSSARRAATNAPEIAAQRVPPSAWSTSQSSHTVRSPSASKSTTERSARPISRWISTVRPPARPRDTSRCTRSPVEAGSNEYSAVIQPRPEFLSQRGISSSIIAVQSTFVLPCEKSTAPCGCSR